MNDTQYRTMTSLLRHAIVFLVLTLAAALAGAQAADAAGQPQVHVAKFGAYTLRANAIQSNVLPASMARQHGIERAADRGVLNLVILERKPGGRDVTMSAEVSVRQENLLGQSETIKMRAIEENGRVSYLGTFGFASRRTFRFAISARPVGSDQALTIKFEDRFVVRGR
ncbi:MAG: DUF4426 domain-containing protein [Acidimicrobiales bacterium]